MKANNNIELRLWEYGSDGSKIESFLESASLAHNIPQKSEAWFRWKFEQSPYGQAILACAFDGDRVVGCVAMGMGMMTFGETQIKCALSYETFVHPQYQGLQIFTKLTKLAEDSCKDRGVKMLYNFPNSNSLRGFIKRDWIKTEISKYKIKVTNIWRFARYIRDIRKPFVSLASNLDKISNIDIRQFSTTSKEGVFIPQWSSEYLKWRFHTYPVGHYWVYEDGNTYAIARIGCRGDLKQAEILHIQSYHKALSRKDWRVICNRLIKETKVDFIGLAASDAHPISAYTKVFIPVPSRSNFTYKKLSDDIQFDTFQMCKSDIDAHTY